MHDSSLTNDIIINANDRLQNIVKLCKKHKVKFYDQLYYLPNIDDIILQNKILQVIYYNYGSKIDIFKDNFSIHIDNIIKEYNELKQFYMNE